MILKYLFLIGLLDCIVINAKTTDYITWTNEVSPVTKGENSYGASKTDKKLDDLEKKLANILPDIKDSMELKLYKMYEKLEDLINTKIGDIKSQLNKQDEAIKNIENKLPALQNDIKGEIDELEKKIPDILTGSVDPKFKSLELQLQGILNNPTFTKCGNIPSNDIQDAQEVKEIKDKLNSVETILNNLKDNINCKSVANYDPQGNIGNKLSVLESREDNILEQIKKTRETCEHKSVGDSCKTLVAKSNQYYQFYPLDDANFLNNVVYQRDNTGATYFHMNIAILAQAEAAVKLSTVPNPGVISDYITEIVFSSNRQIKIRRKRNELYKGKNISTGILSDDVLSSSQFKEFYIKLSNGKLDIGFKNQSPLLTYTDNDFNQIRYFTFWNYYDATMSTFRYDCPIDK